MNIAKNLFNQEYVVKLFNKKVLPLYHDFKSIKKIKITPHKKYIWEETYHVVVEFKTTFNTVDNKIKKLPIFCSAHSDEPRKNVYSALKFLWSYSFGKGNLTIPHPLFYSNYFRGTFYRGVEGKNLYQFIRERKYKEIENIVAKTALWFVKLHNLPTEKAKNFNKQNSRVSTVIPGANSVIQKIKEDYPRYYPVYKKIYEIINKEEKLFLNSTKKRWVIHGDAHPENVIKMSEQKIALIDFTDICLADFARDIGSFLQQLEFMMQRKIGEKKYIEKIKNIFLENYLYSAKIKLDDSLKKRIAIYYNWTALRTSTFFLIKSEPEPERAHGLLVKIAEDMKLDCII
ncbi:MAG: phosphotransferase [Candidatus Falkowbacteria bacterium]